MVRNLIIRCLATLLFIYQAKGFTVPNRDSSEEIDMYDWDTDISPIDESDYWNLIAELKNEKLKTEDEKWNEIDNFDSIESDAVAEQLTQFSDVHGSIKYTIGKRVRGDSLVALNAKNNTWPRLQNIKTDLSYPSRGAGKILTYIEIQVNQSTNLGQAYIVRGGIGKRFISVIVEAYSTYYFNFNALFYGL